MNITILSILIGAIISAILVISVIGIREVNRLDRELGIYKHAQNARLNYSTMEGLEDAIAVILSTYSHLDELEIKERVARQRLERAHKILMELRTPSKKGAKGDN